MTNDDTTITRQQGGLNATGRTPMDEWQASMQERASADWRTVLSMLRDRLEDSANPRFMADECMECDGACYCESPIEPTEDDIAGYYAGMAER